jgi:type IV secretory pathway VirB10-like protein
MEYSKIIAVTGLPGLYELINTKTDGAVVRSLEDNSTKFASSRIHNFTHLESIEIYTTGDNVNLVEIFYAMEKAGTSLPDTKDNNIVKNYFEKVYPDMDFERVYASDLKKMVKWYESLKNKNIEIKLPEPPVEEAPAEKPIKPVEEKKPKKPAAPPEEKKITKPAAKKEEAQKPAKKESSKKEAAEKKEKPAAKKTATKKAAEKKETPKKKAAKKK